MMMEFIKPMFQAILPIVALLLLLAKVMIQMSSIQPLTPIDFWHSSRSLIKNTWNNGVRSERIWQNRLTVVLLVIFLLEFALIIFYFLLNS